MNGEDMKGKTLERREEGERRRRKNKGRGRKDEQAVVNLLRSPSGHDEELTNDGAIDPASHQH